MKAGAWDCSLILLGMQKSCLQGSHSEGAHVLTELADAGLTHVHACRCNGSLGRCRLRAKTHIPLGQMNMHQAWSTEAVCTCYP